ncbi:pyruvate oxidase [Cytobacillus oceanisediminis]|uniref:Pyruvate oxidase n=1 Tax=Cytobacillus oceanisediminis TaxID=665099 RepID=A0A2V3A4Y9_9BACI|nr:pyruvate oxidase [Cytobacillus oceanisediminis]PWW32167.1 pyruvate oxidase [Cytobacillus oceanisediminis]
MFRKRAGDAMMDMLIEWGVDHIYGMPGDSINSLIESIRKRKEQLDFVQVRHEEAGALAAASYAKLTGKLGVCMGIAGPGAIHLLNGLYDAKLDKVPVLAIAGQVETDLMGSDFFQEVDLANLFKDVAVYSQTVMSAEQLPTVVNQAVRAAYDKKGVSVLIIPDDIPKMEIERGARVTSTTLVQSDQIPQQQDIQQAEKLLNKAEKPIILAGKGARGARDSLIRFAEKLNAPIVLTLPGKGIVPDDHPLCLGGLGLLGTKPATLAMEEADTLIMVGTSFPFTGFLPENAKTIHIDKDPSQIGKRYPVDVGLAGDSELTLSKLTVLIQTPNDGAFLQKYQSQMNDWWTRLEEQEADNSVPIKPQRVVGALQQVAADDAILSVDVGNVTVWMARHFKMKNQKFITSGWLATLGCGLPGAIAGRIAYPHKQVFAVCGDGGFQMMMNDFVTAVKYDLPLVCIVFNNHKIAMIKFEQEVMGNAEFGTNLQNPDFARYADICGGIGYRVEHPDDILPALEKAVSHRKPCIIDVVVDANEAPLPAKITFAQMTGYARHMVKELFQEGTIHKPPL